MFTADQSRSATELKSELKSLIALLENINFGSNFPIHKERPINSAARLVYKAKTYNQKTVTIENERILGLPVFTYEISLRNRFDPKIHFKQFQQFSEGSWHDYALLMLTDNTIALLDLRLKKIVSTVIVTGEIKEIHVETVTSELQGIECLIGCGRALLETIPDEAEDLSELGRTVELLRNVHGGIKTRTGMQGFFSYFRQSDSSSSSEVQLGRLDLSKTFEGLLEETKTDEPIYLNKDIELSLAVTMDLSTVNDFTILEKVRRKF